MREQIRPHPGHDPVEIFRRARSARVRASRLHAHVVNEYASPAAAAVVKTEKQREGCGMNVNRYPIYYCKNEDPRS